jgi:hypothetical protein
MGLRSGARFRGEIQLFSILSTSYSGAWQWEIPQPSVS